MNIQTKAMINLISDISAITAYAEEMVCFRDINTKNLTHYIQERFQEDASPSNWASYLWSRCQDIDWNLVTWFVLESATIRVGDEDQLSIDMESDYQMMKHSC